MRDAGRWTPSKYVQRAGRWRASRDVREVGVGSRLVADLVAARYDAALAHYARGRLADLGCGKVPLYGAYRGLVTGVTCVDWPASVHVSPHLDREADLGQPLPFADASFDTLIVSDVLEHLPEPAVLWGEMARLLAPGGHAFVNVPFLYSLHEEPHDYYRYTSFALARFAAGAGLEVVLLEPVGGSVDVWADLLAKHLAQIPLAGRPLAAALQSLVGAFGDTGPGRRIRARTAAKFPLGYFMVCRRPAGGAGQTP